MATGVAPGWKQESMDGGDTFRSDRMVVRVSSESHEAPSGTQTDTPRYFQRFESICRL